MRIVQSREDIAFNYFNREILNVVFPNEVKYERLKTRLDGHPFIILMSYIPGVSLGDLLTENV